MSLGPDSWREKERSRKLTSRRQDGILKVQPPSHYYINHRRRKPVNPALEGRGPEHQKFKDSLGYTVSMS